MDDSGNKGYRVKSRWGNRATSAAPAAPENPLPSLIAADATLDDKLAMAALLQDANARSEELMRERQRPRPPHPEAKDVYSDNRLRTERNEKRIVEDDDSVERGSNRGKRSRWNDRIKDDGGRSDRQRWGRASNNATADTAVNKTSGADDRGKESSDCPNKVKPDFGLSGALATDSKTGNVHNGVTLKFSEPPEARIPNTRWRLYVFRRKAPQKEGGEGLLKTDIGADKKDDDLIDVYHISRQSAYLFGRERKVADIPVDHPSLSKQHAVLQYRALPNTSKQQIGAPAKLQCKPYLMDLESTNGTFINGVRLDSARYYELRRGDVITLGASSREYVLLTEQSAKTGIS